MTNKQQAAHKLRVCNMKCPEQPHQAHALSAPHLGVSLNVLAVHACAAAAKGVVGKAVTVQLQALALLAVAGAHVGPVDTAQHRHSSHTQRVKARALNRETGFREKAHLLLWHTLPNKHNA
jgi:hypothetical protein